MQQPQQQDEPNADDEDAPNPPDVDPEGQDVLDDIPFIDPTLMRQAFMRLGLAPIAAQEFINNGIALLT
jgi:hypothetical protein